MHFQSLVYRAILEISGRIRSELITPPVAQKLAEANGEPSTVDEHFYIPQSLFESQIPVLAVTSSLFFNSSLGPNVISNTLLHTDRLLNFFTSEQKSTTLQFLPKLILRQITSRSNSNCNAGTNFFNKMWWSSAYFRRSLRELVVYSPASPLLCSILFNENNDVEAKNSSTIILPPPVLERITIYNLSVYELSNFVENSPPSSVTFPHLTDIQIKTSTVENSKTVWSDALDCYRLKNFESTFAINSSSLIDFLRVFQKSSSTQTRISIDGGIRDPFFADEEEGAFEPKFLEFLCIDDDDDVDSASCHFHHLNLDLMYTHNAFHPSAVSFLESTPGAKKIMKNLSTLVVNSRCEHVGSSVDDGTGCPHDDSMNRLPVWSFHEILQRLLRLSALDNPSSPLKIFDVSNLRQLTDHMLSLIPNPSEDLVHDVTEIKDDDAENLAKRYNFFAKNLRALDVSATSVTGTFLQNWINFGSLSQLQVLNLSHTQLDPELVGDSFSRLPNLKVLIVVGLFYQQAKQCRADSLFRNVPPGFWAKSLIEVDLRFTLLGDEGLKYLATACHVENNDKNKNNSSLQTLRIQNFDRHANSTLQAVQRHLLSLQSLEFLCDKLCNSLEVLDLGLDFNTIFSVSNHDDGNDDDREGMKLASEFFTKKLQKLRKLRIL